MKEEELSESVEVECPAEWVGRTADQFCVRGFGAHIGAVLAMMMATNENSMEARQSAVKLSPIVQSNQLLNFEDLRDRNR